MTPWTVAHQFLCPWNFPGKHTGVGCHFLLQEIFLSLELILCNKNKHTLALCIAFRNPVFVSRAPGAWSHLIRIFCPYAAHLGGFLLSSRTLFLVFQSLVFYYKVFIRRLFVLQSYGNDTNCPLADPILSLKYPCHLCMWHFKAVISLWPLCRHCDPALESRKQMFACSVF